MQIKVYHSFEDAQPIWSQLEETADYYAFQSYHWLLHWYNVIGKKNGIYPCIVVLYNGDRPVLLCPLGIQKKRSLKILVWLGGMVTDYHAPIIKKDLSYSKKKFSLIWKKIKSTIPKFDAIYFVKMPEKILGTINPFLSLDVKHFDNSYSVILKGTWNDYYENQVTPRLRADSRRQRRRLSEKGKLIFTIASHVKETKKIIEKMIEQKSRRYNETKIYNMFENSMYEEFYKNCELLNKNAGILHVSALKLDEVVLATHWGLVDQNRFYFLMPTFEGSEWRKYSSGRLLLEYLLEWCYENNKKIFDFTIGGERYKLDWCNSILPLYQYVESNTLKGKVFVVLLKLKIAIKKFLKK